MLTRIDKLVIVIITITALLSLPIAMSASSHFNPSNLTVYKAGKKVASYNLQENKNIRINGNNGGYCLLKIEERKAFIAKSTCPLKICQKIGKIDKAGQVIVCAPMLLMYEIESKNNNSLDAVNE